jgi:hypothetical protein
MSRDKVRRPIRLVDGTEMWYPFFAMDVLVEAGLIDD